MVAELNWHLGTPALLDIHSDFCPFKTIRSFLSSKKIPPKLEGGQRFKSIHFIFKGTLYIIRDQML